MDDVLSGLDPTTEEHIFNALLGEMGILRAHGTTVIMTTHSRKYIFVLFCFLDVNTANLYQSTVSLTPTTSSFSGRRAKSLNKDPSKSSTRKRQAMFRVSRSRSNPLHRRMPPRKHRAPTRRPRSHCRFRILLPICLFPKATGVLVISPYTDTTSKH
jgi:hypothetical protein